MGARDGESGATGRDRQALLLFTSLPLYWAEAPDIAAMLVPEGEQHWARRALERQRDLVPVDTFDANALAMAKNLLIVQPRPLAPAENVALDAWVRRGGRVLLFADPALTEDSAFALGDRRRSQDVVLLSPILARWGLVLEFDEAQPLGEHEVALAGGFSLPVNLPGRFAPVAAGRGGGCKLTGGGLAARCRIGMGRVVAVADAALFEEGGDADAITRREAALTELMARAF